MIEKVEIFYNFGFHFGENVDHVIMFLFYVIGIVYYHFY